MSSQRDQGSSETDAAERRLETLAEEMECVILSCQAGEREALHGYAVSLVRDRLPPLDDDASGGWSHDEKDEQDEKDELDEPRVRRTGSAASLISYGMLFSLVGFPLLIVFPLVGILLFVAGAGMCVLGLVLNLFSRSGPSAQTAPPGGGK